MLRMNKIIECKRFADTWSYSVFFFIFAIAAFINSLNWGNKYISWYNKSEFIHCQMSKILENESCFYDSFINNSQLTLHRHVTTATNRNVNIYQTISWLMLSCMHMIMKISKYRNYDKAMFVCICVCVLFEESIVGQNGNIVYFKKQKKS